MRASRFGRATSVVAAFALSLSGVLAPAVSRPVLAASAYTLSETTLDFGSLPLLVRSRGDVTLTAGDAPLQVSVDIQGSSEGYSLAANSCGLVAAQATCTVTVEFMPTVAGAHVGAVTWTIAYSGNFEYPLTALKGTGVKTSNVAWGTTRNAGRNYTWSYGKALGRTATSTKTYLHVVEATDSIGGAWATNSGPYIGVYYVRTADSGTTWTTSKRLNPTTQHADRTALAASGTNVYVAWVSQTKIGTRYSVSAPRVLYVRTNTNHGAATAWRSTVRVSSLTGRVDYPAIAASGANVYVAYTNSTTGAIRLATSRDRGAHWTFKSLGTTTNVAHASGASDGYYGYPAVAVSGTRLVVAWTADANFKVVSRVSGDSGATWSAASTLATSAESEVAVAASSTRFVAAWTATDGVRVRTRKSGVWAAAVPVRLPETYPAHWTPAVKMNGTLGTAVSWAACFGSCDADLSDAALIWAESKDGGLTFPHIQPIAQSDRRTYWSPSIVWAKPDTRVVLFERDLEGGYRLQLRTGKGTP